MPRLLPLPPVAHQWVDHPRFGQGIVRREIPGPINKLLVDFEAVGRKLMLSSYVHELSDQGTNVITLPPVRPPTPPRPRKGGRNRRRKAA
jgi:hypothetical protein